jgi:hypothetical protein
MAKKHAAKLLTSFPKLMKTHLGMEVVIFSAWVETDAAGVDQLRVNRYLHAYSESALLLTPCLIGLKRFNRQTTLHFW